MRKTSNTTKYMPSLGRKDRQTTSAEWQDVCTDSNEREIDENNQTLRPASVNDRYMNICFQFELCQLSAWTINNKLIDPMLNNIMVSSVYMAKQTEQRCVGMIVHL